MRTAALATLLAAASFAAAAGPAAAQTGTTRIEPRPFYGATVTLEEGVRVFRPLPVTRHVIVNPGSQTPLNLSFNDTRVVEESTSHNYHYGNGYGAPAYGAAVGVPGFVGHKHGKVRNRAGAIGAPRRSHY